MCHAQSLGWQRIAQNSSDAGHHGVHSMRQRRVAKRPEAKCPLLDISWKNQVAYVFQLWSILIRMKLIRKKVTSREPPLLNTIFSSVVSLLAHKERGKPHEVWGYHAENHWRLGPLETSLFMRQITCTGVHGHGLQDRVPWLEPRPGVCLKIVSKTW